MYQAWVDNFRDGRLELTGNEYKWQVVSITGLNPPSANLTTSTLPNSDGTKLNSKRLNDRNIVILLQLNGDVESNRQYLYRWFATKQEIRLYFKNKNRNVFIDGIVETNECDLFTNSEQMQISITCCNPYFRVGKSERISLTTVNSTFTFPFNAGPDDEVTFGEIDVKDTFVVTNKGEVPCGFIIKFKLAGSRVETYIDHPKFTKLSTGESIEIEERWSNQGYEVSIDTKLGEKSVKYFNSYTGKTTNWISKLSDDSVFFQLDPGDNLIKYESLYDSSEIMTIEYDLLYEGV